MEDAERTPYRHAAQHDARGSRTPAGEPTFALGVGHRVERKTAFRLRGHAGRMIATYAACNGSRSFRPSRILASTTLVLLMIPCPCGVLADLRGTQRRGDSVAETAAPTT